MMSHLIKKDILLAKKYLIVLVPFIVIAPIFINSKLGSYSNSLTALMITSLFTTYLYYSAVETLEYKNNGLNIVKLLPYRIVDVVQAKYLALVFLFVIIAVVQQLLSKIDSFQALALNMTQVSICFLITFVLFSILYPLLFKFGYEKTKFIGYIIVFLTPFVLPRIVQVFNGMPIPSFTQLLTSSWIAIVIFITSFVILACSIYISSKLIQRKAF